MLISHTHTQKAPPNLGVTFVEGSNNYCHQFKTYLHALGSGRIDCSANPEKRLRGSPTVTRALLCAEPDDNHQTVQRRGCQPIRGAQCNNPTNDRWRRHQKGAGIKKKWRVCSGISLFVSDTHRCVPASELFVCAQSLHL